MFCRLLTHLQACERAVRACPGVLRGCERAAQACGRVLQARGKAAQARKVAAQACDTLLQPRAGDLLASARAGLDDGRKHLRTWHKGRGAIVKIEGTVKLHGRETNGPPFAARLCWSLLPWV